MATWDVSRAHLCGDAHRWIYTYFTDGYEQQGKLQTRHLLLQNRLTPSRKLCQIARFACGRNMLNRDGCISHINEAAATTNSRRRNESGIAERQTLRGQVVTKGKRVRESGSVDEQNDAMQSG